MKTTTRLLGAVAAIPAAFCLMLMPKFAQASPDPYTYDAANGTLIAAGNHSDGVYLLSGWLYDRLLIQNLTANISGPGEIWQNQVPPGISTFRDTAKEWGLEDYLRFPAVTLGFGGTGSAGPETKLEFAGGKNSIDGGGVFSVAMGAFSLGGSGSDGNSTIFVNGGAGGRGGDGGAVTVINRGAINAVAETYDFFWGLISVQGLSYGVVAISHAGGGGKGGDTWEGRGGSGGAGGSGGLVQVENYGSIKATSHGIVAQSFGGAGGDGGHGSGIFYGAGGAVAGSGPGGDVRVVNAGSIETTGSLGLSEIGLDFDLFQEAHGILAQSVGGLVGVAGNGSGIFTRSGSAESAGNGGTVTVENSGSIKAGGNYSSSIFAQSIGGGGGDGGATFGLFNIGGGGSGSAGGDGGMVRIVNSGQLETTGLESSPGIFAQSVGGGGGRGALNASAFWSVGGNGGLGGNGGFVDVLDSGQITTVGEASSGIFAQSVGGGGGVGGGSIAFGAFFAASVGGDGGPGGFGNGIQVSKNGGSIATKGNNSSGIFAQSVGGGGGSGNFAVALSAGKYGSFAAGIGGRGADAGNGGSVTVNNGGSLSTEGNDAAGVFAQSLGGRGGNGGFSFAGTASDGVALTLSVGGDGGGGGQGSEVKVSTTGAVSTKGKNSPGINAESIGGGGGSGGSSASLSLLGKLALNANVGGGGGVGNTGGDVKVDNSGSISTAGGGSPGIYVKSIGGGGGDGGNTLTLSLDLPTDGSGTAKKASPSSKVSVGGSLDWAGNGGEGNVGGAVTANNQGSIHTLGDMSHAIYAQSIGGGGGNGGDPESISIGFGVGTNQDVSVSLGVSVGGNGKGGNRGGKVAVSNGGDIVTEGAFSHGIFAQSVGGGGGSGGGGVKGESSDDSQNPLETLGSIKDALDPLNLSVAVGGNGGINGHADSVSVTNTGSISTLGLGSHAIFAQSIGGGGGEAQMFAKGEGQGASTEGALETRVVIGGAGGAGGNGGAIRVENRGELNTSGDNAHGIFAQSIGGGGGAAGTVTRDTPFLSKIGLGFNFAQAGGNAGDGGSVTIDNVGNIATRGLGAHGIFAQSVGGGGGAAAGDLGFGINIFAGSVGGAGSGGAVSVSQNGNITTLGDDSHGIFAQSAGGQGIGAPVTVIVSGNVTAAGTNSAGILAQSIGSAGAGNISVKINSGTVQGGRDPDPNSGQASLAAGVRFEDGVANTLENRGTITSGSGAGGMAIRGTEGNEVVMNYGTISGHVDLGTGINGFYNYQGALLNSGGTINLGFPGEWGMLVSELPGAGMLINDGALSPGGRGNYQTTTLTGGYVQNSTGSLLMDLDPRSVTSDHLQVQGAAVLGGDVSVLKGKGALTRSRTYNLMEASFGITGQFSSNNFEDRPLLSYEMKQLPNGIQIEASPNSFVPFASNVVARSVAQHLDRILPSVTGDLSEIVGEFQNQRASELSDGFSSLSPQSYDGYTLVSLNLVGQYARSLQERVNILRVGDAFQTQGQALAGHNPVLLASAASDSTIGGLTVKEQQQDDERLNGVWVGGFGQWGDKVAEPGYTGFDYSPWGTSIGYDRVIGEKFMVGVSGAYGSTTVNLDEGLGGGEIDTYGGALYGSWFNGTVNIDAVLSYDFNDYETHRNLTVGSVTRQAQSTHDGQAFGAFVSAGYLKKINHWAFQPFASLQYAYLDESAFTESGAGSVSLSVQDHQTDSLVSGLGLRAAYVLQLKSLTLVPELSAAWDYDFNIDDRVITASFIGAPTATFSIPGQHVSPSALDASAAVTLLLKKGISTSVRYNGLMADDFSSHTISGTLRFTF
jgi:uncharacterized protein YhjY with autotransporter beta-barrel domain